MKKFKLFFEDDFMSGMEEYEKMHTMVHCVNMSMPKTHFIEPYITSHTLQRRLENSMSILNQPGMVDELFTTGKANGVIGSCLLKYYLDENEAERELEKAIKTANAQFDTAFDPLNEDNFMSGIEAYEQEYKPLYRVEKHYLVRADRNRVFISQVIWQAFKETMSNDVIDQMQQTGHCHTRTFGSKTIQVSISYFLDKDQAINYINSIPNAEIIDKENVMNRPIDETED